MNLKYLPEFGKLCNPLKITTNKKSDVVVEGGGGGGVGVAVAVSNMTITIILA